MRLGHISPSGTTAADLGLRPGLSPGRNLASSSVSTWLNHRAFFDPTRYGIPWAVISWTDDPRWAAPANLARVPSIRDASGNGRDPAQATTGSQPGFMAASSALGRRPAVRGTLGTFLASPSFTALTQPVTMVFVGNMWQNKWATASNYAVGVDGDALASAQQPIYSDLTTGVTAGKIAGGGATKIISTGRDLRPGLWTFTGGGVSSLLTKNGTTKASGDTDPPSVPRLTIGQTNNPALTATSNFGTWALAGLFQGDTSVAGWASFVADCTAFYRLTTKQGLIVVDGDSRCTPYTNTTYMVASTDWPARLEASLLNDVRVINFGVPAQTQASMNADAGAQIDPLYDGTNNTYNVAICMGGLNDIPGASEATIEGRIQTWCSARRTAGFQVLVGTLYACASLTAPQNTIRQNINTWIRANWSSWADGLVDLDADSRLSNTADTTYFQADGVHPNETGHGVVHDLVKTQLAALGVS